MNWKKSVFSYILWVVYTAAVCAGTLGITASICYRMNYPTEYGIAITIGYLLVAGLVVLGVRKLWIKSGLSAKFDGSMAGRVTEGLVIVILVAVGIFLRIEQMAGVADTVEGMVYYETAVVTAEQGIPQVVHGATYLYLQLLHLILILFGNKLIAAIGLQIMLQLLAGIVLYGAVRRLAGALAGIFTTAFLMLSPFMVAEALKLSPTFLFLLLYSSALFLLGSILQKSSGNPLCYVIAGVLAGFVCYLDVFGVTIFLVLAGVFTLERRYHVKVLNSRTAVFLFGILGGIIGFLGAIGIDAGVSAKKFVSVLTAWAEVCWPGNFALPVSAGTGSFYGDAIVLFGVLVLGIFSFWCRRQYERQGVWIALTVALIALQGFQMMLQNTGSYVYVFIFLAVLAGNALEAVFIVDRTGAGKEFNLEAAIIVEDLDDDVAIIEDVCRNLERAEQAAMEAAEQPAEHEEITVSVEVSEPVEYAESTEAMSEPRKVQFLDNPLPLPKKHEPKVMNYRLDEIAEDSGYDYAVADDDDFDI